MWITSLVALTLLSPAPVSSDIYEQKIINSTERPEVSLPDLSGYTESAIRKELAVWGEPKATLVQERLVGKVEVRKFFSAGRLVKWSQKQDQFPRIIMIRHGLTKLDLLSKTMPDVVVDQGDGQYLAKLPIAIASDAALLVDSGQTLRLSEDKGVFVVNAGDFYLLNGKLIGWREQGNQVASFIDKKSFRPFYTAWSGSRTYMFGSTIAHLGSASSKAYGLTLSSYTDADQKYAPMKIDRHKSPSGWFVHNRFEDLFYGFYCYEAMDVAIVSNEYANNIYYGIDPHDRSHRLIIAGNHVWGSKVRHGIIVSRDVSDSYIFRNVSHDNFNAGIMLDRQSNRNVIAQNVSYQNGGDGIVLYESDDNLLWANQVYNNGHHGIRFRNSKNIRIVDNLIVSNARFGIYGHLRDLDHVGRDLKMDPYQKRASGSVQGGLLSANHSGAIYVDRPDYLRIQGLLINQRDANGKIKDGLEGTLATYRAQILATLTNPHQQWLLSQPATVPDQSGGQ